jgi:hypothetical protein
MPVGGHTRVAKPATASSIKPILATATYTAVSATIFAMSRTRSVMVGPPVSPMPYIVSRRWIIDNVPAKSTPSTSESVCAPSARRTRSVEPR